MHTPDARKLKCPSCDKAAVRQFLEREPPERAIGVPFDLPTPQTLTWRCTACGYEPDGSFDPNSPEVQA